MSDNTSYAPAGKRESRRPDLNPAVTSRSPGAGSEKPLSRAHARGGGVAGLSRRGMTARTCRTADVRLPGRRERPSRCAAEKRDELPPPGASDKSDGANQQGGERARV